MATCSRNTYVRTSDRIYCVKFSTVHCVGLSSRCVTNAHFLPGLLTHASILSELAIVSLSDVVVRSESAISRVEDVW